MTLIPDMTDKLTKVGNPGSLTTLQPPGKDVGATSILLTSPVNWPTETAVIFSMQLFDISKSLPIDGSYTVWKGILSGSSVDSLELLYGSDQQYPAGDGAQVMIYVSTSWANSLIEGLLQTLKPNGTLIDQVITAEKVANATLTATQMAPSANPETRMSEARPNYVASGCTWSVVSGLNGAMLAGVVYVGGKRVPVPAIPSLAFAASQDTYIYADNTGNVQVLPVANGATPPTLPEYSIWLYAGISAASLTAFDDLRILADNPLVIGRRRLGTATNNFALPAFAAKSNLRITIRWLCSGGTANAGVRFNGDASTICPVRFSTSGATDQSGITTTYIPSATGVSGFWCTRTMEVTNVPTSLHPVYDRETVVKGSGATVPDRLELSGTWPNTPNTIVRADVINAGSGTFGAESEIIVEGWN